MRGLDHPTTKIAYGAITARSHDIPKKLDRNFMENLNPLAKALEIEVANREDKLIGLIVMMMLLQLLPRMVVSTKTRLKAFDPFSLHWTSRVPLSLWHSQVSISFLILLMSQKIVVLDLGSSIQVPQTT